MYVYNPSTQEAEETEQSGASLGYVSKPLPQKTKPTTKKENPNQTSKMMTILGLGDLMIKLKVTGIFIVLDV